MGYNVNKSNSCIFTCDGEILALGIVEDTEVREGYYIAGLFRLVGTEWQMIGGPIKEALTDADIMAHGSMYQFFVDVVWAMGSQHLQAYKKSIAVVKPDPSNKVGCAQFDVGPDTDVDKVNYRFGPNKPPPLSHAR
jgi:hypothetical protein